MHGVVLTLLAAAGMAVPAAPKGVAATGCATTLPAASQPARFSATLRLARSSDGLTFKGTGEVFKGIHCGTCGGRGKIRCSRCKASGEIKCKKCKGTGTLARTLGCKDCKGRKTIACPECKGQGHFPPPDLVSPAEPQ